MVGKLIKKQACEVQVPALNHGNAYEMIKEVYKHADANKEEFSAIIMKALMAIQHDAGKLESSTKEIEEFAQFVTREISNKMKQLADEGTQVRYSLAIINLAMNVYLQSHKSYEDLQKHSLTALPCICHLQHMKSLFQSMEGNNPACYAPLSDGKFLSFPARNLCIDKVTIKSDLVWNVKNNKITGFCNVSTSPKILKEQLKRILSNEDKDDTDCHAVMANQWQFLSVFNEHHTSEFFFNNGSLDSDKMV